MQTKAPSYAGEFGASIQHTKQTGAKAKFEFNLEALRGFAALTVVLTHCVAFSAMLNKTTSTQGVWAYRFPGHLAVLIFFTLSGYVIGLTTKKSLTWQTIGLYLKKRFVRLYPIYIVCILLALLLAQQAYPLSTILSNLVFLQRVTAEPLNEIGVIWSLNYEVLFYLLFIPISVFALRPEYTFLATLLLGLFFQLILPVHLLAMYSYGFCFWLLGLWLTQTDWVKPAAYSRYTLLGLLSVVLAYGSLNFMREFMHFQLHLDQVRGAQPPASDLDILLSDLSYLPLGVLLITAFTNKQIRYSAFLTACVLVVPLLYLLLQVKHSRTQAVDFGALLIPSSFYLIGVVLLAVGKMDIHKVPNLLPSFLVNLGAISYGVYLIHLPLIILLGRIPFFQGTVSSFVVRACSVICLALLGGYFLDKIWQPFIMRQAHKLAFFKDIKPIRSAS